LIQNGYKKIIREKVVQNLWPKKCTKKEKVWGFVNLDRNKKCLFSLNLTTNILNFRQEHPARLQQPPKKKPLKTTGLLKIKNKTSFANKNNDLTIRKKGVATVEGKYFFNYS